MLPIKGHPFNAQSLIATILAANLTLATAATPAIGVATTDGDFTIDRVQTSSNATVFDGNTVETGSGLSRLRLNNGTQLRLASESRGKIYSDRLVLEQGGSEFETSSGYRVEANSLKISASQTGSARVSMRNKIVQVAALNGAVRVTNASGVVLANMTAGNSLSFHTQAGASGSTTMTGTLTKIGDLYFIKDETSSVMAELKGEGLEANVGKRVEVTGSLDPNATPSQGATQVVNVTGVKTLGKGKRGAAAAGAAAAGAGAGAGAGVATGTTVAIVAGVAVAATATGVGLYVARRDDSGSTLSPNSR